MEPSLYSAVNRLQFKHWWYRSRRHYLDVLLHRLPRVGLVLDAGCGPGSMLHYLKSYGVVVGLDCYLPALEMARSHFSGPLVQGDNSCLPFRNGQFALIAACETLYHQNIPDVRRAVAELVRVLGPGGHLLVVDSAYAACRSSHDHAAHGARRFTRRELAAVLHEAGLQVVHSTYGYALLLPVVWCVRCWKSFLSHRYQDTAELRATCSPLNKLLISWFSLEAQLAGRWGLPFGLSVQVLGRKPVT